jgi:hypothetical protein
LPWIATSPGIRRGPRDDDERVANSELWYYLAAVQRRISLNESALLDYGNDRIDTGDLPEWLKPL